MLHMLWFTNLYFAPKCKYSKSVCYTLSKGLDRFIVVKVWCITWGGGSSKNFFFFSVICVDKKKNYNNWILTSSQCITFQTCVMPYMYYATLYFVYQLATCYLFESGIFNSKVDSLPYNEQIIKSHKPWKKASWKLHDCRVKGY